MFRFTIRELVLVTAVVALTIAWWIDHCQQVTKNYRAEMQVWKFRAQTLAVHIETYSGGKVSFGKSNLGKPYVRVQVGQVDNLYGDHRWTP